MTFLIDNKIDKFFLNLPLSNDKNNHKKWGKYAINIHLFFQDAIKECMDQIEVSICMSMSGMSFQPTNEITQAQRQYVKQENHQSSYHHTNATNSEAIVVPTGMIVNHSSASSKTVYLSSASTTPTDLMDVVSSATCVGAY